MSLGDWMNQHAGQSKDYGNNPNHPGYVGKHLDEMKVAGDVVPFGGKPVSSYILQPSIKPVTPSSSTNPGGMLMKLPYGYVRQPPSANMDPQR